MAFVERSFCLNSCHYRGVCYNDSGIFGCVCDDVTAAEDCSTPEAESQLCERLLVFSGVGLVVALVCVVVLAVVVIVLLVRRSEGVRSAPQRGEEGRVMEFRGTRVVFERSPLDQLEVGDV